MASRNNRSNTPRDHDDEEYWDGQERRCTDRRYHQVPPGYYQPTFYVPPPPVVAPVPDSKNVAQTTLTLQQLSAIVVVVGSVLLSGFSAWSNLNKELDIQKNNLDQFKTQISKDVDDVQSNMKDLKRLNEDMRAQNQKTAEALEHRIQELDASLTQIYQKVSAK